MYVFSRWGAVLLYDMPHLNRVLRQECSRCHRGNEKKIHFAPHAHATNHRCRLLHHSHLFAVYAPLRTIRQVSFDGSYRNRNHTSHAVNVVASVKRMKPDHRGLMDSVLDQVTFGRHTAEDAPLQPVCALSRNNGFCGVHGKAADWDRRKRTAKGASPEEEDAARRLRHGNCYSSTCLRSPLSAPATEPLGIIVLCLRLMYEGFWVNAFAHDQDAGIGHIVRELFDNALECLDRAHIQVRI